MRKIYYLASFLLISGMSLAQHSQSLLVNKTISDGVQSRPILNSERAAGDPIGPLMDFSDPTDWVIANTGTPSSNWVIGTAGPTGGFSESMDAIVSTSGGNFAMFDSDALGSNTSSQNATITSASPIDLSAYSNVGLTFESYYRNFQGSCFVGLSTDGVAWTDVPVHSLLPLNESTDNPEVVSINISGIVANEATVWVRFRYEGAWDYAWMIDDVQFVEGFEDNLVMNQAFMSAGTEALDYYMIPTSQIQPTTFGAWVENNGINDQMMTMLNVVVNDGTSDVYNESSVGLTVPAFTMDSLELTTVWTPVAGEFEVTLSTSSVATDQFTADNELTLEPITVGGSVYARDNGISTGSVGYLGETAVATSMGNIFEMVGDFNLGEIMIGVGSTSSEGEPMYADVRLWNGTEWVYVDQTQDHQIVAGDLGSIITLTLDDVIPLQAGDIVYVGAAHYGGNARFLTAQVAEGAIIFNEGAASQQNSVFIVRMGESFAGVEETAAVTGLQVYPNPASTQVTFAYTLSTKANVSLVITDLTGKTVSAQDFGMQNGGNYSTVVSTSDLSNGVYFYTLSVDGVTTTEKLTITNN